MARKRSRRKSVPAGSFDAQIDDLASDARGIARIDNKVVFIEGALPGERVQFHYTRCKSDYDEGVLDQVLEASPDRVQPACAYHSLCGGCSLQHLSSDAQISMKQKMLLDNLQQAANIYPDEVLTPITGERWGYRRKARLGVRDVKAKGRVLVGFREKANRYLADIHSCEVLHPSVGRKLDELSNLVGQLHGRKVIAQIEVAVADDASALIFRHLEPLDEHDLELLVKFAGDYNFIVYLQPGGIDTIEPLWPVLPQLHYALPEHDIRLAFEPSDFTQVNTSINRQMVSTAIELLQIDGSDNVLDLFCGLGNFTLAIAKLAQRVTGIEGDAGLLERARQNAVDNNIHNVVFQQADLFEDSAGHGWANQQVDKLLLDPPRSGAQAVVEQIHRISPERIVYVSCHPATLARDTAILLDKGYRLLQAGVMDMFPHTMHVESMAVFIKDLKKQEE